MKYYQAELEKLQARHKRQMDKLTETKELAGVVEDAFNMIPVADSPEIYWDTLSSRWSISVYPLELPRVTEALKHLAANGFRFTTHFPKEVNTDCVYASMMHNDSGLRLSINILFTKSATCKLEPTGEMEEARAPRPKMRLVCTSGNGRRLQAPDTQAIESGSTH